MSFRKVLATLGAIGFVSTAMLSAPVMAQDLDNGGDDDAGLWFAGLGIAGATVLAIVFGTSGNDEENPPASP